MISVELSKRFKKIVREAGREAEVSATLKLVLEGFGQAARPYRAGDKEAGQTSLRVPHRSGVAADF